MPPEAAEADLRTIREELHCTAVMVVGSDPERLEQVSRAALEGGLEAWVRPRCADRSPAELLAHLAEVAERAEGLRRAHPGRVVLLVGTEFSLTSPGLLPGGSEFARIQLIRRPWLRRRFDRRMNRRLGALLAAALATARGSFGGPVTYGAGGWERVDWSGFDIAGVNLYRFGTDAADYARRLDALLRTAGRPVVVTEFGCGAHVGGDLRGAGSFFAVNWFADPPRLRRGTVRDEHVQARYLGELLDLYRDRDVHGAFVFTFAMPGFPHSATAPRDLDAAGFGVVAVPEDDPSARRPKEAFREVAARYRDAARQG
ncbi:hypothetical protein J0910_07785 [Nocardiopsis sp. CNT-189]